MRGGARPRCRLPCWFDWIGAHALSVSVCMCVQLFGQLPIAQTDGCVPPPQARNREPAETGKGSPAKISELLGTCICLRPFGTRTVAKAPVDSR